MAVKHLSLLLLLLTLLSSPQAHARDSQMFNKVIPNKVNENVVKETPQEVPNKEEEQEPNFIPENENSYGLYGHESGQLPPSTTTTTTTTKGSNFPYNAKYLPKNYNPVSYVTQPEDFNDSSFEDKSYTNGANNNYYNGQQQPMKEYSEFMDREYTTTTNRNQYYNNGVNNNFNVQPQGISGTRFIDRTYTPNTNNNNNNNYNNYYTGGRVNRVQPQGMSDTRFLENGRYFYDTNAEKYSREPHENAKEFAMRNQQYNTRGYYVNDNSNQYNNYMEGQEQYHDEEEMP